jgi:hypothetical protein
MPSAIALMNYISSSLLGRIICQTGTFRRVFSPYISFITLESAGGISAAIRELYCTFADFLQNWNFPQNNINFAGRNSKAAMASSVASSQQVQRRSEGYSVAQ